MVPYVFISSTIADLQHVRDALRDRIERIGYLPVLSEHNGVGYVPRLSAIDSCMNTVRLCSIAVVIIGKQYNANAEDASDLSVTHREYRTARDAGIPLFYLVDKELLLLEKVFSRNKEKTAVLFPKEMDNPARTFAFLDEVRASDTNNGILVFDSVTNACDTLTTQLAHFFGDLLANRNDAKADHFREVLSEVTRLREDVLRQSHAGSDGRPPLHASFIKATDLLASDTYKQLRSFLVPLSGGLVEAVTELLAYESLDAYVAGKQISVRVTTDEAILAPQHITERKPLDRPQHSAWFLVSDSLYADNTAQPNQPAQSAVAVFVINRNGAVAMNPAAYKYLAFCYSSVRAMARMHDHAANTPPNTTDSLAEHQH